MTKLFAGVDGGGSKTMAVVVDEHGRELGRYAAGASNYHGIGLEAALESVREAISKAVLAANVQDAAPERVLLGLAGIDRPADYARWREALAGHEALAAQVDLCGDSHLILYALPKAQGLGVIAGTGSIALGQDARGKQVRSGGWGHFLGDEGSGFWLGHEALYAAVRASDGRGPKTSLLPLILKEWNLKDPSDLIGAVYGSGSGERGVNNTKVARLSGLVFAAAEEGDETAKLLIRNATNELALAIKACDSQLFFPEPPGLAVAGGLLLNNPAFLQALIRRLEAMMTVGEVVRVDDPALVAARAAITGEYGESSR
ncbi:MAG TPA: BadF/BadG/BcrA/BcrD ATPase family protein [Chloroflexia bacterium]|nr:BadF/BadG/BcrA/BcrD ATPase family protein [Chloroflexia bacterium]